MIFTNPTFEKISTPQGGSILVRKFSYLPRDTRPYWHYHPELELVGDVADTLEALVLELKKPLSLLLISANKP